MRVPFLIGVLVMNAMRSHPRDRTAFQRQRPTERHKVFDGLWYLVRTMGQQPVVTHADATTDRQPIKQCRHHNGLPLKHEKGRYRADMKQGKDNRRRPIGLPGTRFQRNVLVHSILPISGAVEKLTSTSWQSCGDCLLRRVFNNLLGISTVSSKHALLGRIV
jgi:hypothetical protein